MIGSRCRVRDANPVCPVDVQDPRNNIIIKDIDNVRNYDVDIECT